MGAAAGRPGTRPRGRPDPWGPGQPSVGFLVIERKSGRVSADSDQEAGMLAPVGHHFWHTRPCTWGKPLEGAVIWTENGGP